MERLRLDDLDRAIVCALQVDARATWGRLADVLGTSERTIARRLHRLTVPGILRIVGVASPYFAGYATPLIVRARCAAGAVPSVLGNLARRNDTLWVDLLVGGLDICFVTFAGSRESRNAFLFKELPGIDHLADVSVYTMLHNFSDAEVWHGGHLTDEQYAALRAGLPQGEPPPGRDLSADERALLSVLARDGRASYGELGSAIHASESTARRRFLGLVEERAVGFHAEIELSLLGFHAEVMLWISVRPAALDRVGRALAAQPNVRFAAATTGPVNLVASVCARDLPQLYDFLVGVVGGLPEVDRIETTPIVRTVKRSGVLRR
ncbi:Lrp/AsnC family transcriptional regulator [Nonomuraea sp. NPDC050394]|uniref:Lrp/AsnC family transcriptional regulator n=1 Tax=Nonomuraea sp. NPDC050394 TaxID=3364363 RepID=UPI00379850BB